MVCALDQAALLPTLLPAWLLLATQDSAQMAPPGKDLTDPVGRTPRSPPDLLRQHLPTGLGAAPTGETLTPGLLSMPCRLQPPGKRGSAPRPCRNPPGLARCLGWVGQPEAGLTFLRADTSGDTSWCPLYTLSCWRRALGAGYLSPWKQDGGTSLCPDLTPAPFSRPGRWLMSSYPVPCWLCRLLLSRRPFVGGISAGLLHTPSPETEP